MLRQVVIAVGAGLTAAVLWLSQGTLSAAGLLLAAATAVPLFLATLSRGLATGGVAVAAAAAVIALVAQSGSSGAWLGPTGTFLVMVGLPALLVSRQALLWQQDAAGTVWWYPADRLVMWLAGIAAVIGFAALAVSGGPDRLVDVVAQELKAAFEGTEMAAASPSFMLRIVGLVLGLWGVLPAVLLAINAMVAQAVLVRSNNALRPTPDYPSIRVPDWLAVVMLALYVVGFNADGVLAYSSLMLASAASLPFWFIGLAVLHAAGRRWFGNGVPMVVLGVTASVLVSPAALVVMMGALDGRLGFRRRLAPPS